MSKPHVCPRCHGEGKLSEDEVTDLLEEFRPDLLKTYGKYRKCPPCQGKGVIWKD